MITLVLYFGTEKHWDKPRNLKSLLEIPDHLEPYVNDYKIHVFEIAWLTEEEIHRFRSDFQVVARFFVNKRKNPNYMLTDPTEIRHVDAVLKLLSVITADSRYMETLRISERRITSMCDVAERLEQKGKNEGRAEGRAEERTEMIIKMYDAGLSIDEICNITNETSKNICNLLVAVGRLVNN